MFKDRDWREFGSNVYVPAMQFADAAVLSSDQQYSLGSPAASTDNLLFSTLAANTVALTTTDTVNVVPPYRTDARYGRTMIYTISGDPGAAGSTIELRGWDYLRQPMRERVTCANGGTGIFYGNKAFAWVQAVRIITQSTNAVTWKIGTGTRLGLPYKGDVVQAKEAGILVPVYNRSQWLMVDRSAALAVAGGTVQVQAPFPGFVKTVVGVSTGLGSTNDPVLTVTLGGVAITGLTATINDDVAGRYTGVPSTPGYRANNRFVTNGLIAILGTASASAVNDSVGVEVTPMQVTAADLTDPMTTITGDPRGTYDPLTAPNGTEIIVNMIGDNAVNASNNGGLHGIRQEFA